MLERALGLSAPQLVRRNIDLAEAVSLPANVRVLYITRRVHRFLLDAMISNARAERAIIAEVLFRTKSYEIVDTKYGNPKH